MKETVAEFLARGGKITVVPQKERETVVSTITPSTVGPANLLTLGEADLFFGEIRVRKPKKSKPIERIDINSLPAALRDKYFKELLSDNEE